ncbi:MAG: DUF1570 domain-containing protein [Phycisphaerales bacterium]|nr:DUF1570 domain-containing protein [Phycisphaerales bacterium]
MNPKSTIRDCRAARSRFLFAAICVAGGASVAYAQTPMRQYSSKYYEIYTDLEGDALRDADARITAMAETYYKRTRGFSGTIRSKMPFYLFRHAADYYKRGGMQGSAGMYNGQALMAIAGKEVTPATWHVIQHEGFHQFVDRVIGGEIPVWVNEGLAEYFGEAIFTGDRYVTGVIPPDRLERLRAWIGSGNVISVSDMMRMPHHRWNEQLSIVNYDQAWSMVHFLAHAENGKYQKAFESFISAVGKGQDWQTAWKRNFGADTRAFERKWREYWAAQNSQSSADVYAEAACEILTQFYARAFAQRQYYPTFEAFLADAKAGALKADSKDWLPDTLLREALAYMERFAATWSLGGGTSKNQIVCDPGDGTKFIGTIRLKSGRVRSVSVREVRAGR